MTLLGFLVLTVVAWVRQHRQLAQRLKAQQEAEARLLDGISEHGRRLRARLAAQSYDESKATAAAKRARSAESQRRTIAAKRAKPAAQPEPIQAPAIRKVVG